MKLASVLILLVTTAQAQQIPSQLFFPLTSLSVNGSSATGHCTDASPSNRYRCDNPTSSVVYDGHIPILTGLDGNMWASQLLTINASNASIVFNFTSIPNFQARRVEMVVFNCPQWGISTESVVLTNNAGAQLGNAVNPTLSSCDSLVRICIPYLSISYSPTVLGLVFTTREDTNWVHIAEVGFYGDGSTCPPESIITTPADAIIGIETRETPASVPTTASMTSCSTSIAITFFITAIITALLATLIFVLLQIALCKYHPKFKPGKPESATLAGGEELRMYEPVDINAGNETMNSPNYIQVGVGKGKAIDLKENEAYGIA